MKKLSLMVCTAFLAGCASLPEKRETITFTPVRILRGSEGNLYLFLDRKDDPTIIDPSHGIRRVSRTVTGIPKEEPVSVRMEWTKGNPPTVHSFEIRVHTLAEIESVVPNGTNSSALSQR